MPDFRTRRVPRAGIATFLAATLLAASAAHAGPAAQYGSFGPEGSRLREQLWILPSGDPAIALRATVFRPDDAPGSMPVRRPLAVINHGTSEATRLSVAMPVFYWLSRWFVEHGYVVVLPQRRGHGATGGDLAEDIGTCAKPDHYASGLTAAEDIRAVVDYMTAQPGIAANETIVAGISTGGWASLALAARKPQNIRAIVNFAGGRGGHAGGMANAVCGERALIKAAADYGRSSTLPTVWFYSRNDSYFGPKLATAMARAWTGAGGRAALHVVDAYAEDGHDIASDRAGWDLWGRELERFLESVASPAVASNAPALGPSGTEMQSAAGAGQGESAQAR
jgi:dienelactone hydrolase